MRAAPEELGREQLAELTREEPLHRGLLLATLRVVLVEKLDPHAPGLARLASSVDTVHITRPRSRSGSASDGTTRAKTNSVPIGSGRSVPMKVPPREMFLV